MKVTPLIWALEGKNNESLIFISIIETKVYGTLFHIFVLLNVQYQKGKNPFKNRLKKGGNKLCRKLINISSINQVGLIWTKQLCAWFTWD